MFPKRLIGLFLVVMCVVLVLSPLVSAQQGASPAPVGLHPFADSYALHGPYWVGTRELILNAGTDHVMPLMVWYPALNPDGLPEAATYAMTPKWVPGPEGVATVFAGHALKEAAPDVTGGPYPVLVFSPGLGTNAVFYTNIVEHVASQGFVVMAPDHLEAVYLADENPMRDLPRTLVDRPRDISAVLAFAAELNTVNGALAGMLDLERVAVAGHSLGGYAALAAGGARFDTAGFSARCALAREQDDPNAWLCDPVEPFLADIAAMAGLDPQPEGLWPSWGDPRIDAVITMAGDSYMFDQAGLADITVPVLALGGTADTGTPAEWGVIPTYAFVSSPQKALVMFENAEHGIFGNDCDTAPWLVEIGFAWFCADPIWDRQRTNDLTNYFVTAFLLATLKGDSEAAAALAPDAVQLPGITYQASGF